MHLSFAKVRVLQHASATVTDVLGQTLVYFMLSKATASFTAVRSLFREYCCERLLGSYGSEPASFHGLDLQITRGLVDDLLLPAKVP